MDVSSVQIPKKIKPIFREILATERTFVAGLDLLIKNCYLILQSPVFTDSEKETVKKFLKPFEDLLVKGQPLRAIKTPEQLQAFLESEAEEVWFSQYLASFIPCVTQYSEFSHFIQDLQDTKKGPQYVEKAKFINKIFRPNEVGNPIGFYIILPVQRVPRYALLFQDAARRTSEQLVGYEKLLKVMREQNASGMNFLLPVAQLQEALDSEEDPSKFLVMQDAITGFDPSNYLTLEQVRAQADVLKRNLREPVVESQRLAVLNAKTLNEAERHLEQEQDDELCRTWHHQMIAGTIRENADLYQKAGQKNQTTFTTFLKSLRDDPEVPQSSVEQFSKILEKAGLESGSETLRIRKARQLLIDLMLWRLMGQLYNKKPLQEVQNNIDRDFARLNITLTSTEKQVFLQDLTRYHQRLSELGEPSPFLSELEGWMQETQAKINSPAKTAAESKALIESIKKQKEALAQYIEDCRCLRNNLELSEDQNKTISSRISQVQKAQGNFAKLEQKAQALGQQIAIVEKGLQHIKPVGTEDPVLKDIEGILARFDRLSLLLQQPDADRLGICTTLFDDLLELREKREILQSRIRDLEAASTACVGTWDTDKILIEAGLKSEKEALELLDQSLQVKTQFLQDQSVSLVGSLQKELHAFKDRCETVIPALLKQGQSLVLSSSQKILVDEVSLLAQAKEDLEKQRETLQKTLASLTRDISKYKSWIRIVGSRLTPDVRRECMGLQIDLQKEALAQQKLLEQQVAELDHEIQRITILHGEKFFLEETFYNQLLFQTLKGVQPISPALKAKIKDAMRAWADPNYRWDESSMLQLAREISADRQKEVYTALKAIQYDVFLWAWITQGLRAKPGDIAWEQSFKQYHEYRAGVAEQEEFRTIQEVQEDIAKYRQILDGKDQRNVKSVQEAIAIIQGCRDFFSAPAPIPGPRAFSVNEAQKIHDWLCKGGKVDGLIKELEAYQQDCEALLMNGNFASPSSEKSTLEKSIREAQDVIQSLKNLKSDPQMVNLQDACDDILKLEAQFSDEKVPKPLPEELQSTRVQSQVDHCKAILSDQTLKGSKEQLEEYQRQVLLLNQLQAQQEVLKKYLQSITTLRDGSNGFLKTYGFSLAESKEKEKIEARVREELKSIEESIVLVESNLTPLKQLVEPLGQALYSTLNEKLMPEPEQAKMSQQTQTLLQKSQQEVTTAKDHVDQTQKTLTLLLAQRTIYQQHLEGLDQKSPNRLLLGNWMKNIVTGLPEQDRERWDDLSKNVEQQEAFLTGQIDKLNQEIQRIQDLEKMEAKRLSEVHHEIVERAGKLVHLAERISEGYGIGTTLDEQLLKTDTWLDIKREAESTDLSSCIRELETFITQLEGNSELQAEQKKHKEHLEQLQQAIEQIKRGEVKVPETRPPAVGEPPGKLSTIKNQALLHLILELDIPLNRLTAAKIQDLNEWTEFENISFTDTFQGQLTTLLGSPINRDQARTIKDQVYFRAINGRHISSLLKEALKTLKIQHFPPNSKKRIKDLNDALLKGLDSVLKADSITEAFLRWVEEVRGKLEAFKIKLDQAQSQRLMDVLKFKLFFALCDKLCTEVKLYEETLRVQSDLLVSPQISSPRGMRIPAEIHRYKEVLNTLSADLKESQLYPGEVAGQMKRAAEAENGYLSALELHEAQVRGTDFYKKNRQDVFETVTDLELQKILHDSVVTFAPGTTKTAMLAYLPSIKMLSPAWKIQALKDELAGNGIIITLDGARQLKNWLLLNSMTHKELQTVFCEAFGSHPIKTIGLVRLKTSQAIQTLNKLVGQLEKASGNRKRALKQEVTAFISDNFGIKIAIDEEGVFTVLTRPRGASLPSQPVPKPLAEGLAGRSRSDSFSSKPKRNVWQRLVDKVTGGPIILSDVSMVKVLAPAHEPYEPSIAARQGPREIVSLEDVKKAVAAVNLIMKQAGTSAAVFNPEVSPSSERPNLLIVEVQATLKESKAILAKGQKVRTSIPITFDAQKAEYTVPVSLAEAQATNVFGKLAKLAIELGQRSLDISEIQPRQLRDLAVRQMQKALREVNAARKKKKESKVALVVITEPSQRLAVERPVGEPKQQERVGSTPGLFQSELQQPVKSKEEETEKLKAKYPVGICGKIQASVEALAANPTLTAQQLTPEAKKDEEFVSVFNIVQQFQGAQQWTDLTKAWEDFSEIPGVTDDEKSVLLDQIKPSLMPKLSGGSPEEKEASWVQVKGKFMAGTLDDIQYYFIPVAALKE